MIIPDGTRGKYLENLIGGLAMNLAGPFTLRLAFHAFVVVVGTMILAGAVNTAIVGSNGVLNRVSRMACWPTGSGSRTVNSARRTASSTWWSPSRY